METVLLSIDWDYFIPLREEWCGSYVENRRNLSTLWYKRYIESGMRGENLEKIIDTGPVLENFWERLHRYFKIDQNTKIFVSDSHKLSYKIAKKYTCTEVYLFDAHADLGYGGLGSLDFELNCANWLGKLLQERIIRKATIIYSPYTREKEDFFTQINQKFNIEYCTIDHLPINNSKTIIHVCRSGAWTPPWLDRKFIAFVEKIGFPFQVIDCPAREWNPEKLAFSAQVNCLLS